MTVNPLKRLILVAITLIVGLLLGSSLVGSLGEPQITDRLQLYQTDLLLHVTELQTEGGEANNLKAAQRAVLGDDPLSTALKQYQTVRQSAETNLDNLQVQLQTLPASNTVEEESIHAPISPATVSEQQKQVKSAIDQQQSLINQLDLRIGLLEAEQGKTPAATATWTNLIDRLGNASSPNSIAEAALVLSGLWSEPPRILPDAEQPIQQNLEGWFRYQALTRLYELQQRTEALSTLQATEQATAQQTLVKLVLVSTLPTLAALVGIGLLITLGVQWLVRSRQPELERRNLAWEVPWNWETIAWVLVVGFFFAGQIAIPWTLQFLSALVNSAGGSFSLGAGLAGRSKAFYTLAYYLLMSGTGLLVLYLSVKPFFPLPEDWFRLTGKRSWLLWGVGGYFVALPLMLGVSLVNQQIWQGQGGSNPLLQIVLEEGDPIALTIFFITAAIAAPIFEEILFRGFLLPSLTRYFPVWGAIALSSLLFALAHLSLSEVLPLAILGSVLGTVYTRSRGLLAPMLLHSLWNSITMIGLFILGSGVK